MTAAHGDQDIADWTRRRMRDAFADGKLIVRMVADLKNILSIEDDVSTDVMHLWDNRQGLQKFGVQYREYSDGDDEN